MTSVDYVHQYRRNTQFTHPERYRKQNILIIRYFQGWIGPTFLASWFDMRTRQIYQIWSGEIRPEIRLPETYSPPLKWQIKAQELSKHSQDVHYLSDKNRAQAKKDILVSRFRNYAEKRLLDYIDGKSFTQIAHEVSRSHDAIKYTIKTYFRKISKNKKFHNREWIHTLRHKFS
jgi:hypothetical protein